MSFDQAYEIGFRIGIDLALQLPKAGFNHMTFYGLSNGNFTYRPQEQVQPILSQLTNSMVNEIPRLINNRIRVKFYGPAEQFLAEQRKRLKMIEKSTAINDCAADLSVLMNYSPEWDLRFGSGHLETRDIPACDFIFRSGRAKRLSGFLPMQSANAALHFSVRLWPDIQPKDVLMAVSKFSKAKRYFGA
jgi:undecaprenyl pyrophosphate synthase